MKKSDLHSYIATDLKALNRKTVFELLKEERELSRAEIARRTGISTPTTLKIVNFLLRKGFAEEIGNGQATIGRKPRVIRFKADAVLAIGIEFEGELLKMGLVDLDGEIVVSKYLEVSPEAAVLDGGGLEKEIKALLKEARIGAVAGIGIGVPGVVDPSSGIIRLAPLVGIREPLDASGLMHRLASRFGVPVRIENDVNVSAVGEFALRRRDGVRELIYLSLGTGFGAGIIIDGVLRRGASNYAGEIGYTVFDARSTTRSSDAGWLERRVNLDAILERLDLSQGSPHEIEVALRRTDPRRLKTEMKRVAGDIALCVANMENVLDVQLVVMGGLSVRLFGDMLLDPLRAALASLRFSPFEFVPSACKEPGVVGAAMLALESAMDGLLKD